MRPEGVEAAAGFDWSAVPYEPKEALGQGAMGAVFRARDTQLDRDVAIKLLLDPGKTQARARFVREGRLTAAFDHPNLLKLLSALEVGDHVALVFELVPGARSLDQAWGAADDRERVRMLLEGARGVAHAHAAGIVHRDLKPENVLVDDTGRVRVADFGVGYSEQLDRLTATGTTVGTPFFMAPEQFARERESVPTPAADVWSLGVLLYLALSDAYPFPGPSLLSLAAQVQAGATPEVLRTLRGSPPALVQLVRQCLHPDPARRPSDASVFADSLQGWLAAPSDGRPRWAIPVGIALATIVLVTGLVVASSGRPGSQQHASAVDSDSEPLPSSDAPPPRLLSRLTSLEEPQRSLAALEILDDWPSHPVVVQARRVVQRLRREPLLRLYVTPEAAKDARQKDWEVRFDPRRPHVLQGLLDRTGVVAHWDLRTGDRIGLRRSSQGWMNVRFHQQTAVCLRNYKANGGLWKVDLAGTADRWFLPPAKRPAVHGYAVDPAGTVFVVLADQNLLRYTADGALQRTTFVQGTVEHVQVTSAQVDRLLISLGGIRKGITLLFGLHFPPTGVVKWRALGQYPGIGCRIGADSSGAAALAGEHGNLAVVLPGAKPRRLRRGRAALIPLGVAWSAEGRRLWYHGQRAKAASHTRLELWDPDPKGPGLLGTWQTGPRTKGLRVSPDGRFVVLGYQYEASEGIAAEVWYVGRHVLNREE